MFAQGHMRQQCRLLHKRTTSDDFIGAADALAHDGSRGLVDRRRILSRGMSAGGPRLTKEPDLLLTGGQRMWALATTVKRCVGSRVRSVRPDCSSTTRPA